MTREEFEHIAREMRPRLLSIGRQFFGDEDSAEDVAQEALLRLWMLRDRIAPQQGIEPLAVRLAKNICVSEWRRQQVRRTAVLQQEPISNETANSRIEAQQDIERLRQAILRLKPAEQRLFRMRHEQEMELAEITAVTGIGPRSVSAMLSTAKRKLLDMLTKEGGRK